MFDDRYFSQEKDCRDRRLSIAEQSCLKTTVNTVSCRRLQNIWTQTYCQDSLLPMFGKYVNPKNAVKKVTCRCMEDISITSWCQHCLLSMIGECFIQTKTVKISAVNVCQIFVPKDNVKTVSCQYLISTPFTKYCQDHLLLIFNEYSIPQIVARLSLVDVLYICRWKNTVKTVPGQHLPSSRMDQNIQL